MVQKGETQKPELTKKKKTKKYKITTNQELQTVRESLKMKIKQKPKEPGDMQKEVSKSVKIRCLQTIKKGSSETLVKNRYHLKNQLRKKQQKTFWHNILENNREHSHSAEWIKREEKKYDDAECQEDWSQYKGRTSTDGGPACNSKINYQLRGQ